MTITLAAPPATVCDRHAPSFGTPPSKPICTVEPWCSVDHNRDRGEREHRGSWRVEMPSTEPGKLGPHLGTIWRWQAGDDCRCRRVWASVYQRHGQPGITTVWDLAELPDDEWWAPVVERALRWVAGQEASR